MWVRAARSEGRPIGTTVGPRADGGGHDRGLKREGPEGAKGGGLSLYRSKPGDPALANFDRAPWEKFHQGDLTINYLLSAVLLAGVLVFVSAGAGGFDSVLVSVP